MAQLPTGVSTIPEILGKRTTNQTQLAICLGINRGTLRKYLHDDKGKYHVVVNGVFYSRHGFGENS